MKILLTLDYELFLDDIIGTVENSLIKPMQHFHAVCKKHNVRATIFVDAAYLYMLNKLRSQWSALQEDYDKVVENIKWLEQEGHDIELHIHPQWYYSTYDKDGWHLDWEHYKLSTAPYEESLRLFTESKNLLDSIIGRKTIAFRAGGYSIQQFNYKDCFKKNGIVADSSVFSKNYQLTPTHYFDYRKAPSDVYQFEEDITKETPQGSWIEFPITVGKYNFLKYMMKKKSIMNNISQNWGDGGALPHKSTGALWKRFTAGFRLMKYSPATIDWDIFGLLEDITEQIKASNTTMTIIGHPKLISSSSMDYLDSYITRYTAQGVVFTTMKKEIGCNL